MKRLGDYLSLQGRKTTLSNKEKEIVNLVTSQFNNCSYCLAAHTAIGKMNGFSDEEIIAIRKSSIEFNPKYAALAEFVQQVVSNKGKATELASMKLLEAGYTKETIVDVIVAVGDKTIMNYLHNLTQIPVDFPAAPAI